MCLESVIKTITLTEDLKVSKVVLYQKDTKQYWTGYIGAFSLEQRIKKGINEATITKIFLLDESYDSGFHCFKDLNLTEKDLTMWWFRDFINKNDFESTSADRLFGIEQSTTLLKNGIEYEVVSIIVTIPKGTTVTYGYQNDKIIIVTPVFIF